MTFPAQSPDLRRFPLVAGASRSVVRSPRSAAPRIRFLFVDSRVRFTLRSAYASRRTPCASLRSLRPGSGRTFTSKSSPMPGPRQQKAGSPGNSRLPARAPPGTRTPNLLIKGQIGGFPAVRTRFAPNLGRSMCRLGRFMCRFKAADVSMGLRQELQIVRPTKGLCCFLP